MLRQEIGLTAGQVYEYLASHGEASLTQLQRAIKASRPNMVTLALGWLAREDRIEEERAGKTVRFRLLR